MARGPCGSSRCGSGPLIPPRGPGGEEAGLQDVAGRGRIRRGGGRPFQPRVPDTLHALYERYCDTEARELLALIPREGLRSLWGRARERAQPPGEGAEGRRPGEPPPDALDLLRAETRALLPLPPYEVWVRSYLDRRGAYLERMGIPSAPERAGPVTVAVRPVDAIWWAHLNLERREDGWVGHLAFHMGAEAERIGAAGGVRGGGRTTDIFRGESPDEIRERFREFTAYTLQAFLRSVTPGP